MSTKSGKDQEADEYTLKAWRRGTQVPNRPNVKQYDFGHPVGTGPKGGKQSNVYVHTDSKGVIHGHPQGREK